MESYFTDVFKKARKSVYMVSGALSTRHDMTKSFEATTDALDRGVKIEIVSGPIIDEASPYINFLREEGRIELFKYPFWPDGHIRIRDYDPPPLNTRQKILLFLNLYSDSMFIGEVYIEGEHTPIRNTEKYWVIAYPAAVRKHYKRFKSLKSKSEPATIDDFRKVPLTTTPYAKQF